MERELKDIKKRSRYIRAHTPNVLVLCFEMQNHICDLCGHPIQCILPEVTELDHSVPVYHFAAGPLDIKEAEKLCNNLNNLRAVHGICNVKKGISTREVWFAKEMDKLVGPAPFLTDDQISFLKFRASEIGRKGGLTAALKEENRNRIKKYRTLETCSDGGKKGGAVNVKTGQIISLGYKQGKKNKENGHWDKIKILGNVFDSNWGRKQGLKNVANGHLASLDQGRKNAEKPNYMSEIGKLGGKKGGAIVSHTRWHVKRNIVNPNCSLCQKAGRDVGA